MFLQQNVITAPQDTCTGHCTPLLHFCFSSYFLSLSIWIQKLKCGPNGAGGQRHRGSYLSSRSPAPPVAFLFPLGTTSPGALGHTGQEQGQTSGLQGCRSGCCLQKSTETERKRRQGMCASHMLSNRPDNSGLAGQCCGLK